MFTPEIKLEHADRRGEIYSIALPGGHELMLLHSNAGSLRGGHSHDCDEVVVLLSGRMRYHKKNGAVESKYTLYPGQSSFNPTGVIHMGEFLDDSWLIEYKLAKKGDWKQHDYEPYRAQVRANSNK